MYIYVYVYNVYIYIYIILSVDLFGKKGIPLIDTF